MSRKELIKYISQNSGETENWGNLIKKRKTELEQIYDYLQKVKEFEGETPEPTPEPKESEVEEKEENVLELNEFDDSVGEEGISIFDNIEEEVKVVKPKIKNDGQEYITIDKKPSALSASERKAYARTGRLPKKKVKVNKYTRFDDEEVKFGF